MKRRPLAVAVLALLAAAAGSTPGAASELPDAGHGGSDCLTPVLLAAARASRPADDGLPAAPPALAGERTWTAGSGLFRVHYTTLPGSPDAVPGADEGGVPSYLEAVEDSLTDAYRLLVDDLGMLAPEAAPFVEVYLTDLGPGIAGAVLPRLGTASPEEERRTGTVLLSNRLADPGPAAAHQLAHLVQLGYSHREPVWWHEASAAWVAVLASGSARAEAAHIRELMASPEAGLETEDRERMRGLLLLPAFLSLGEASGASLRAVWERCGALAGDNLLEALDGVARATGRGSLEDLLRAFYASWVADAAGRTRLASALALELPQPGLGARESLYPAAGVPAGGPVAPLGASYLHFTSRPGQPGGLSLTVLGSAETTWDVLLLVRSGVREGFAAVPLAVDERGQAQVRFPWGEVSDSLVMVINMERGEEDGRLSYWARHQVTIPFDLLDFHAAPGEDAVALEWTTDSETDVQGWNLYRSSRPGGGFERLNGVPIPGAGTDRAGATYTFFDASARGRKVYYYLEAFTREGFRETTHIIGAYPARAPDPR